jgi:mannose-6-phosphate isomerase-like protein (cupin superfamily)
MTISQSAGHPSRTFYRRRCMAHAGETIENPVTHDRVIFRLTAQDTKGTLLAFDDVLLVGYISPPEHVHPRQEERFEVISGSLGVRAAGRDQVLSAGESVAVPPGTPHTIWNAGEGETRLLVEFRPALQTEAFFETMFALARDGKTDKRGSPSILQFASGAKGYGMYVTSPPIAVQKALFAVLGPLARALRYQPQYGV